MSLVHSLCDYHIMNVQVTFSVVIHLLVTNLVSITLVTLFHYLLNIMHSEVLLLFMCLPVLFLLCFALLTFS